MREEIGYMKGQRAMLEIIQKSMDETDHHASRHQGVAWANVFFSVLNNNLDKEFANKKSKKTKVKGNL